MFHPRRASSSDVAAWRSPGRAGCANGASALRLALRFRRAFARTVGHCRQDNPFNADPRGMLSRLRKSARRSGNIGKYLAIDAGSSGR